MRLDELFTVSYGNKFDMNKMVPGDKETGVAFVGRRGSAQGLSGWVKPLDGIQPYRAGLVTVALGGSRLLSSFVQQRPFYTAQNVAVLTPKETTMPLKHRLYYTMCIKHNDFRYTAFGREANRTLGSVLLPDTLPEWVDTFEIPTYSGLARPASGPKHLSDTQSWSYFTLGSLFEVAKGRRLTKAERIPGAVPFVGASEKHNGITDHNDLQPLFKGHCLTVPYNGNSVGWAFYQPRPFFASDDVHVLRPRHSVSMWALLFIAAVIKHERFRFTYGYKWTMARMAQSRIRLPEHEGEPDWLFMEGFMRSLPFSAALEARVTAALTDASNDLLDSSG